MRYGDASAEAGAAVELEGGQASCGQHCGGGEGARGRADALKKVKEEEEARRKAAVAAKEAAAENDDYDPARHYRCGVLGCDATENPVRWCVQNAIACEIISIGPAFEDATNQLWGAEKNLLGIGQLESCIEMRDIWSCPELMQDALVSTKLKLLSATYEKLRNLRRGCTQCFLAGTKVLMGDGFTKQNIEDIKPGQEVIATEPLTGETGPRKVQRLIVTEAASIQQADDRDPQRSEELTATHEHPFWSPSCAARYLGTSSRTS
jgi:hypothetical protein